MKNVIYIVALVLVAVFALANWQLIARPVELNLLVATVRAPLGVLILLVSAVIILIDLVARALNQRTGVRERQALLQDLEGYRRRAEGDEQPRIEALRAAMDSELTAIRGQLDKLIALRSTPDARAHGRLIPEADGEPRDSSPHVTHSTDHRSNVRPRQERSS